MSAEVETMTAHPLLDAADSLLVVVDTQPGFLGRLEPGVADTVVERIAWLVRVARQLGVPVVVTEEESDRHGSTDARIREVLPAATPRHEKAVFGLADQLDILDAVVATGRRTAVLVGLEADVCVAQSAIGLLGRGYRVAVVADATASPAGGTAAGLDRIRSAGGLVTATKGLFYEWTRTVAEADTVMTAVEPPADLVL
ncbi:MAG TPA: isochorismatase family protein [Candidatus Limnocylindrales bacterium]|nr:isochorismatase family protein [Candidatus Limnocylindrales bacterium]